MIDRPLASSPPLARWLVLNAGLALAYYLAAQLGLTLAIGSLHITPVWPPAGIALASFMIWGRRTLPGLLLGAVITHYVDYFGPHFGFGMEALLGSSLLAVGGMVSAWLAAWGARKVPERIEAAPVRQTLRFVLSAGAACLIAALVGQGTLLGYGALDARAIFFGWLTWWVGDTAGMLLVAPVLLMWLHPAFVGRRVAAQAFPIISIGLGVTLFSTLSIGVMEREVHVDRFRSEGTQLAMAMQNHVDMAVRDLEILQRAFYKVELTPVEFRELTNPMLLRSPWQQDFAYLPRVEGERRTAFEQRSGFSLRELSPRESVVLAAQRNEYFPVLWTAPEAGHDALVGIDHLADPTRGPAIQKARESARIAASPPLHSLLQSASTDLVQVLYAPLSDSELVDQAGRTSKDVRGMVAATIDIAQLLRAAMAQMGIEHQHLLLYDPEATAAHALEWPTGEDLAVRSRAERDQTQAQLLAGVHHEQTLRVGDRRWIILMQPAWAQLAPKPGWLQLVVFATGLGFTALLTGFMIARRRHDALVHNQQQALEAQVEARTHELGEANQSLRAEVAERQHAQRELLVFRWLAESAHQGLGISELTGKVIYLNPAIRRMAGEPDWTPGSNRKLQDYLGPRMAQVFEEQTLPALRESGYWEGEWHIQAKGERPERWLAQSHFLLKDDLGEPIYMASLVTDTTAQRQAEEQLRLFRWFAESAQLGLGIADFDYQVVYMNPTLRRMARRPDWQPGQPFNMLDVLTQGFRERFITEAMPALRAHGYWEGEMRTRARDGDPGRWLAQSHFVVKDDQGHPLCMASITTDITAQRQMEDELREAQQKAEGANRAKSMFLANMSHEIRTPLNAVLGFTQVLLADQRLPQEAHQRLTVVLSAGNRLLGLINDVLDLAKIESGRLNLVVQPLDLQRELTDITEMFATRVTAKGLAWDADLSALPAPSMVQGDRTKIGQVVINLLGNALKFTETGRIRLQAWREGEAVWIEVEDTGPGMDAAELDRLFAPFSQGEAGRAKGGSGLGLVLSRDIARAMGGELTLDSKPGTGTRARVMLPLPPIEAAPLGLITEAPISHLDPATPCRALVVEDDPDSRDLLVKLLQDVGCSVAEAEDGQAGLEAAQAERFDIVFSDIRMPRMTGVEMIRALRAAPATAALPVIAVTASSLEHERRFYSEIGFQDFVPKPYPFRDIYKLLARHAGVRFIEAAEEAEATAGTPQKAKEALLPPDGAALALLRQLQSAAAEGDAANVKSLLAELGPELLGEARRRAWEDAARRYDFQGLERAVKGFLDNSATVA